MGVWLYRIGLVMNPPPFVSRVISVTTTLGTGAIQLTVDCTCLQGNHLIEAIADVISPRALAP